MTPMQAWWQLATTEEKVELADALGTSLKYLSFYALGIRQPSAERGIQLEHATKTMSARTKGRLPVVHRTDVVSACRSCEFALKCLGRDRIEAGAFPVVKS